MYKAGIQNNKRFRSTCESRTEKYWVFKETDPFQSITYSILTSNKNCVGRWQVLALDNYVNKKRDILKEPTKITFMY